MLFHPRLNPRYSSGVSSPGRHVRTRLYFTSESHIHSLLTVLTHGGLVDVGIELNIQSIFIIFSELFSKIIKIEMQGQDEQWRRAMEYVSLVSEFNYMTQVGFKIHYAWEQVIF